MPGIDSSRLTTTVLDMSQYLDTLQQESPAGFPEGSFVGDVLVILEIKRPAMTSVYAQRWADGMQRHHLTGMIDAAVNLTKQSFPI